MLKRNQIYKILNNREIKHYKTLNNRLILQGKRNLADIKKRSIKTYELCAKF